MAQPSSPRTLIGSKQTRVALKRLGERMSGTESAA